jgi:hypothetical protein
MDFEDHRSMCAEQLTRKEGNDPLNARQICSGCGVAALHRKTKDRSLKRVGDFIWKGGIDSPLAE